MSVFQELSKYATTEYNPLDLQMIEKLIMAEYKIHHMTTFDKQTTLILQHSQQWN